MSRWSFQKNPWNSHIWVDTGARLERWDVRGAVLDELGISEGTEVDHQTGDAIAQADEDYRYEQLTEE